MIAARKMPAKRVEKAEKAEKARPRGRKNPLIPEMIAVGKRIAEARNDRGLTQAVLARKLGTSAQALGQVEQGWRAPTVPWLAHLATALGVDLTWVLSGVRVDVRRAVARLEKHAATKTKGPGRSKAG